MERLYTLHTLTCSLAYLQDLIMLRANHLAVTSSTPPRRRRRNLAPYLFILPGLLFFLVLWLYPLVEAFRMSLYNWKIMPGAVSEFVGLANYQRAFQDEIFWIALKNTVLYTVVTVPGQMILAMGVALLLDAIPRGRVLFRVLYYIPVITSWVVVSLLFRYLFESSEAGFINYVLMDILHVISEPIQWMREPETALIAVMTLGIWKGIGWSMVIFLAALQGIPAELHEAASIDGANSLQRLFHITLPSIRPTLGFVTVMLMIGGLNVFISVYLMTGGGPVHRTETVLTYMYNQAFNFLEFGYGSALAYILAFIVLIVSIVQLKFFQRPQEA